MIFEAEYSNLFMQLAALSAYVVTVGFCFCDGFKLPLYLKGIWFIPFAALSVYTFYAKGKFDMPLIIFSSSLLALAVCSWWLRNDRAKRKHG